MITYTQKNVTTWREQIQHKWPPSDYATGAPLSIEKILDTSTQIRVDFKNTDITYRSYRNLNVDAFRQDVESIPFSVCNVFDDINDSHWAFNKLLNEVVNEHIPIKSKRTRKHEAPFVNDEYRKAIRSKASSWHSYLREKSNENWHKYRRIRNKCTALRVTWGKAPPRGKAPLPSNYEFTYASGSIS